MAEVDRALQDPPAGPNTNTLTNDHSSTINISDDMPTDTTPSDTDSPPTLTFTIHHNSKPHTISLPSNSTIADLSLHITSLLQIPESSQKLLISPKVGLLKPPFTSPDTPHSSLPLSPILANPKSKITVLGNSPAHIESVNDAVAAAKKANLTLAERARAGPVKAAAPSRTRDWRKTQDETTYTFMAIRPLPHLHAPEKSQAYLERLAADPGIKYTMTKHKWSVGLLTEMDPAQHTTHESRTLGLNRNAGEVIELRLRTDDYEGYRDYKTIRKTLCHELTHNVFGEHDGRFWKLCGEVEKEVERGDWRRGGRSVGDEVYYEAMEGTTEEERRGWSMDHGGWVGEGYLLGGGGVGGSWGGGGRPQDALSRRDVIAKAAEERAKKAREGGG